MLNSIWAYYSLASLLVLVNAFCWCLTLVTLPGNWLMVASTAFFAWVVGTGDGRGIGWPTVGVILALAVLGELLEFAASAAGAARQGGSRRSVVLAVAGALIGSLGGAAIGLPVPIIGPAIAAVFGGAIGAFGGALSGEHWKGRPFEQGVEIGRAAFIGRFLGTAGKLAVGVVMVVITAVDAFV